MNEKEKTEIREFCKGLYGNGLTPEVYLILMLKSQELYESGIRSEDILEIQNE